MSVFLMESRGSPAATDGLVAPVFIATQCSRAGSAWDQPFPWHSAGSEPQPPVVVCFGAFVWCILDATKQLLKPATAGTEIFKA